MGRHAKEICSRICHDSTCHGCPHAHEHDLNLLAERNPRVLVPWAPSTPWRFPDPAKQQFGLVRSQFELQRSCIAARLSRKKEGWLRAACRSKRARHNCVVNTCCYWCSSEWTVLPVPQHGWHNGGNSISKRYSGKNTWHYHSAENSRAQKGLWPGYSLLH